MSKTSSQGAARIQIVERLIEEAEDIRNRAQTLYDSLCDELEVLLRESDSHAVSDDPTATANTTTKGSQQA